MKTIFYLAMTAREFQECQELPENCGYMACHFSPYEAGLDHLPATLPPDCMVILNDRIPFRNHDCRLIARQLASLTCGNLLLDLRQSDAVMVDNLIREILSAVSFPVAVPEQYAAGWDCPVFLEPSDADADPFKNAGNWPGRELWLDLPPGTVRYQIGKEGAIRTSGETHKGAPAHRSGELLCHYHISLTGETAEFTLWRDIEDAQEILRRGIGLGITRGIGLWQEWSHSRNFPEN